MQLVWAKVYLLKPGANIGLSALRLRFILEHGMIRLRWLFLALGWSRGSMTRWLDARRHTRNFPSRPNVAPPARYLRSSCMARNGDNGVVWKVSQSGRKLELHRQMGNGGIASKMLGDLENLGFSTRAQRTTHLRLKLPPFRPSTGRPCCRSMCRAHYFDFVRGVVARESAHRCILRLPRIG